MCPCMHISHDLSSGLQSLPTCTSRTIFRGSHTRGRRLRARRPRVAHTRRAFATLISACRSVSRSGDMNTYEGMKKHRWGVVTAKGASGVAGGGPVIGSTAAKDEMGEDEMCATSALVVVGLHAATMRAPYPEGATLVQLPHCLPSPLRASALARMRCGDQGRREQGRRGVGRDGRGDGRRRYGRGDGKGREWRRGGRACHRLNRRQGRNGRA